MPGSGPYLSPSQRVPITRNVTYSHCIITVDRPVRPDDEAPGNESESTTTTAQDLTDRSNPFLDEVINRTTGGELETRLNGGALIALFYLPTGRISYDITPPA